jgi:Uma2 family endonuclease
MSTIAQTLLTAEEFARLPNPSNGSREELVRGERVPMVLPSFRHAECQAIIIALLRTFLTAHPLGRVVGETGIVTERDPDSVRGPDVAFWSNERLPPGQTPAVYAITPADLCIEILSPNERQSEILTKIVEYSSSGVRMVWVADPELRNLVVYRSADEGKLLHQNATLVGEDVLPGFQCKVAELFP